MPADITTQRLTPAEVICRPGLSFDRAERRRLACLINRARFLRTLLRGRGGRFSFEAQELEALEWIIEKVTGVRQV